MERPEVFDVNMTLNRIFIRPEGKTVGTVLIFNRDTEGVKIKDNPYIPLHASKRKIFGIIGVIQLVLCKYLIVITRRSKVDTGIRSAHSLTGVWRINKVNLIPLSPGRRVLTAQQKESNEEYILMVLSALNTGDFYYSHHNDLTVSLRQSQVPKEGDRDAFIWNEVLLHDLIKIRGLDKYCIRIMNGFIRINYLKYLSEVLVFSMVSRRWNKRVGPRFFKTGINDDGEAANFVETEVLLEGTNVISSFIILGASVPLVWDQWPNLSWNPKPTVANPEFQISPFNKHFEYLSKRYGDKLLVIDLSQHNAYGTSIHHLYQQMALKSGDVKIKFMELDLKDCQRKKRRKMDEDLVKEVDEIGFTLMQNDVLVIPQKGTIRVSSLDCTEYTNVAQSILTNIVLSNMLKVTVRPDIQKSVTNFELQAMQKIYNRSWLLHGDVLANHYIGTIARNGQMLDPDTKCRRNIYELWIPFKRWYVNNFECGFRQDSLDLILGHYKMTSKRNHPTLSKFGSFKILVLDYILPGIMTFITLHLINYFVEFFDEVLYHEEEKCVTMWSLGVLVTWILFHGILHHYVDEPKLYTKKPQPL
ncbi:hypothetical protein GE061_017007 [Apolygus lucorum]|uniref:Phosphatidylinositol-3-phosphatase SAC1 n=1 Tax=Apolygus lucorum TaxID=248454 RepID=A0A6A4JPZ8_APOLU|nr:hypothetical protein GE061_017007 [Apolygus lucorum]